MFNPVAPYGYLLPIMYLLKADVTIPALFVCGCQIWICLDITRFYEEPRQPSSMAGLVKKEVNLPPLLGAGDFDTNGMLSDYVC